MVTLYVGDKPFGPVHGSEPMLAELLAANVAFHLRDESGAVLGRYTPEPPAVSADDFDIPEEEVQRRLAEPGLTWEQVKQRLGLR